MFNNSGFCFSYPHLFTPGKEYVYIYSGKMLNGIPEVENYFAGVSITGKVIVQTVDSNSFKLAVSSQWIIIDTLKDNFDIF